jgi:hypothetical protein
LPFQNFGTFSKISLNTSEPPKRKNVQNVEAHNFAVEWHGWFGVQEGENGKTKPWFTVHRRREIGQVGMAFLLEFLNKTPTNLSESCR